MPMGFPKSCDRNTAHDAGPTLDRVTPGVHETEEHQHELDGNPPGMLEPVHRIGQIALARIEESEVARFARHERKNRDHREGRMHATEKQRRPRQPASKRQIRPEARRAPPAQPQGHAERGDHQGGELHQRHVRRRIEQRQHNQAQGIVGDRQQQKKGNRRMIAGKDETGREIRKGNVSGTGDCPARHQIWTVPHRRLEHVETGGTYHASSGRYKRHRGLAWRLQRTAGQRGFNDLLHSEGKEKHHSDVVDDKPERGGEPRVRRLMEVRPQEAGNHSAGEEQRVFNGERPGTSETHCAPGVGRGHQIFCTLRKFESMRASS